MDADRLVELRIGLAHDRRHRAAGGETSNEDPIARDRVLVAEALGQQETTATTEQGLMIRIALGIDCSNS